jgi:sugar/nucleoside kinase (ribokinase family)
MNDSHEPPVGLFVGLITLDLIYLAEGPPGSNEKAVAEDFSVAAGGPACNAAATFSHLGGRARLVGALGCHPLAALIREDLAALGVEVVDLTPRREDPPPVSSVVVSRASGERAVISRNAVGLQVDAQALPLESVRAADVVLVDGHQMGLAAAVAATQGRGPLVVDAGSWKPSFEAVLARADYVLASAVFRPPGVETEAGVFAYLEALGVPAAAVTHGPEPIRYRMAAGEAGEVAVPAVKAVDTLGAGDVLHGAFCRYCTSEPFPAALGRGAAVAARACTGFGTRAWMGDRGIPAGL